MGHLTVITACYGGFDMLRSQAEQTVPVTWLCFTDDRRLDVPAPWRRVVAPAAHEDPRMAAKVHKLTPQVDVPDVVWIDANMEVTARHFARCALAARRDGMAVWRHPRRRCIYAEAVASVGAEGQHGKYDGWPILDQAEHYRAEGFPPEAGLYACGTVAWDLADPVAVELGRQWLEECERWSPQDQISLPVVARRLGITPGVFNVRQIERRRRGVLENRWLRIHPHLR